MSNRDDHHVEVFSRWRGNHITFVAVAIPILTICGLLAWSITPFLGEIGQAVTALLVIACLCGAILAVVGASFGCLMIVEEHRRRKLHSRLVSTEHCTAYLRDDGKWDHLSAQHEAAKLLPAPLVKDDMIDPEQQEIIDRSRVLTMHLEQNRGMHAIADETGIPYQRVREWCNIAKKLRAKLGQTDQGEA
jgi:hypothetical protein